MKPNIRWQLLLAIVCLGLVLSLLSFQVQTDSLCTTRVPAGGGSLAEGLVGAPQYINPLLSDANPVDRELVSLIFDGLTRYGPDGRLEPVLAESWQVSDDGLSVTFTLRQDVNWHDGQPFTAEDVLFTYGLLQNPDFPAPAGLQQLWQAVAISSDDAYQVTFTLPEPYAPFMEMTTRGILPAHRLAEVPAGEVANDAFNSFPIGTGPFMVSGSDNWPRTGRMHLLPYAPYWPQGIKINDLEYRFYPDNGALLEAYRAGEIQAINNIPASFLADYLALPGIQVYTAPTGRYSQLLFNLSDSGLSALREKNVRQGLVYALDRAALVDQALNGQGLPLEGPYLPNAWAYNPGQLTPYAYDGGSAAALLDAAGWPVPAGSSVRQNAGTPLVLRLLVWDVPPYRELADLMAEQWSRVNVRVELVPLRLQAYREALAARDFDVALVDITPPGDPDLYDFWSQEAIVRGQNYAGWNNRRASEALEQARQLWPLEERRPLYDAFLAYYNNDLPALTLFQYVYSYGINETVNEAEIGRIDNPRERYATLANWFLLYRDVTISCPEA